MVLASAFGCTLTISRIGSVVNYDATSLVYDAADETHPGFGLGITLWIGSGLVAMSYLANAGIIYLENKKQRYDSHGDLPNSDLSIVEYGLEWY